MIIFVLGGSGVGKDTIVDMLVDIIGRDKAYKIRSWTTREPRYEGEDTHNFLWWPGSTRKDRVNDFFNDRLRSKRVMTYTHINGEYYWMEYNQFGNTDYEFYIIDLYGLLRALKKIKEDYMILKIVRPKELIDVDEDRLKRVIVSDYREADVTFFNVPNDIESIREPLKHLAEFIKNFEREEVFDTILNLNEGLINFE